MTQKLLEPKPIYRALTEEEVRKGLNDPDKMNPITMEVTRLAVGYVVNLQAYVKRFGYIPPHLYHHTVRWPIEKVAVEHMRPTVQEIISKAARDS